MLSKFEVLRHGSSVRNSHATAHACLACLTLQLVMCGMIGERKGVKRLHGGRPCGQCWVLTRLTPCECQFTIPSPGHPHVTDSGSESGAWLWGVAAGMVQEIEKLGELTKIEIL